MFAKVTAIRIVAILLAGWMFALVAVTPLAARYSPSTHDSASHMQSKVEDSKVTDLVDQDVDVFSTLAIDCEMGYSPTTERVADDRFVLEPTLADCHLQRGPPRA